MTEFSPATGSEDVHLLIAPYRDVPFSYTIVGVADPAVFAAARKEGKMMPHSAHNPNFVVDLKAIPVVQRLRRRRCSIYSGSRARNSLQLVADVAGGHFMANARPD